jgi:L-asparagine oxygenase
VKVNNGSYLQSPTVDYEFSDSERTSLTEALLSIEASPYADHLGFLEEVWSRTRNCVSSEFRTFCERLKARDKRAFPIAFVRNAPIDPELPEFDWTDPVESKRRLKRTFVSEGFLALFAHLQERPAVAHMSVNEGDFYHDIFPKKDMAETQSQKTEKTLNFHKDFTNHFARPDCVYTLTIRNPEKNEVVSTYVSNAAVIHSLPEATRETLRQPIFETPFDDISTYQQNVALGEAPKHAILESDGELRVFENRTRATTNEGAAALEALLKALHAKKTGIHQQPGDFVAIENDFCLHGREVGRVADPDALRRRWLMKTHNVSSYDRLSRFFLPGKPGVING